MSNPVTIYFTSSNDIWMRSFEIDLTGSFVVFNGYNIRGLNGLIVVDIAFDTSIELKQTEVY